MQELSQDKTGGSEPPVTNEMLLQMLGTALDVITYSSSDGVIHYVSPSVVEVLGYKQHELVGKKASDFYHQEDIQKIREKPIMDRDMVTYRVRHKNGYYVWLESTITLIRDDQGNIKNVINIGRDITKRRSYEMGLIEAQRLAKLGSWEWGVKGNTVTMSEQMYEMFSLDRNANLSSNDLLLLIHPEDQQRYSELLSKALAGTEKFSAVFRQLRVDGSLMYLHIWMAVIFDEDGAPERVYGTTQDVTERNLVELQLQESVERYTSLKKYNHDAIISFALDGRINHGNDRAEQLTGFSISELTGVSLAKLIGKENLNRLLTEFNQDSTVEKNIDKIKRKDGEFIEVLSSVAPIIINNKNVGFYLIAKDMTEEKKLLIEKEAAERTNQAKTQFLAMMSHEIRTPMNAIIGLTDLLLETTELDAEQKEFMNIIRKSGNTLISIINDILDFSKIESGTMDLHESPMSVTGCIAETLDILKPRANNKQLALNYHVASNVPTIVFGDHEKLKQVLINLIGNAVKFTEAGYISVSVRALDSGDEAISLEFSVKDTGMGVPKEKGPNLFEPFYQLDSYVSRSHEGSGLGLAICRKLVQLMGGRIYLKQTEEQGSTFVFTIVVKCEAETNSFKDEEIVEQQVNQSLKILIAEDNKINQIVLMKMLEKQGYDSISVANNGQEAVESVLNGSYDLVFMDVNMPVMDGLEATKHIIKALPPEKCPAIIGITANALRGDREKCLAAGMNDYISKPVSSKSVADSIQGLEVR